MDEGHENRICNFDELQKAIAQLPPKQQVIVQLLLQGFQQKEIADELDIDKSTVNEYVKLVRKELRPAIYPMTINYLPIVRVYPRSGIKVVDWTNMAQIGVWAICKWEEFKSA
jgi:DNA-binding CsgD family transcriptional regulator